jgi:hypothetical protein
MPKGAPILTILGLAILAACTATQWESKRATHPATEAELAACRVTVEAEEPLRDELNRALAVEGFTVVDHPPYKGDLLLRASPGVGKLTSDDFFVDEVRAPDAQGLSEALARSRRVAEFVRDSGTVQQRENAK